MSRIRIQRRIDRLFRAYVARVTPPTVSTVVKTVARAAPTRISPDNVVIQAAAQALRRGFGAPPRALVRSGGTIPVVDLFQRTFGAPVALMGFGQRDDGMHAPNEKFHLPTFFKAIEASIWFVSILERREWRRRRRTSARIRRLKTSCAFRRLWPEAADRSSDRLARGFVTPTVADLYFCG